MRLDIYGRQDCAHCVRAKSLCKRLGIEFTYRDIFSDEQAKAEMFRRFRAARTVPVIFAGDYLIGGYADLLAHSEDGRLQQIIGGK